MRTISFFLIVFLNITISVSQHMNCSELMLDYINFIETDSTKWSLKLSDNEKISLVYFGAMHSKDPSNSQFEKIEAIWNSVKFDVALYEGPDRGSFITKQETIEKLGESGFVRFLAKRDSIQTQSLEANPVEEIQYLLEYFSIEKIKLFFVLREAQRVRESFGWDKAEIVNHIQNLLLKANNIPSLKGALLTIQEIEDSFIKYWGYEIKWWEAPSNWFDPLQNSDETGGVFTNDINRYSSNFRNINMYQLIVQLLKENKTVFAVVGRNHIPMQSKALMCEWEKLKKSKIKDH